MTGIACMGDLDPIAFDIETSGLDDEAVITVAGFATHFGEILIPNTSGKEAEPEQLEATIAQSARENFDLIVTDSEPELLEAVDDIATNRIDVDRQYLTAYNGETWKGGFDLPFVRTACVCHNVGWPFPDMAYVDVFEFVDRFDTGEQNDLVGVYNQLIGKPDCDPFNDSGSAVDAFENGEWKPLLLHNLADIQRTLDLARLGEQYVPRSDFQMKNLSPPSN